MRMIKLLTKLSFAIFCFVLVGVLYIFIYNLYERSHSSFEEEGKNQVGQFLHATDRCQRSALFHTGETLKVWDSPWYPTVTPNESYDSGRSHVFPFACSLEEIAQGQPLELMTRVMSGFPGIYNVVTRNPDELFLYGGTQSSDGCTDENENKKLCSFGPYVAKINAHTLKEEWRTLLHNTKAASEWDYPGAIGVHGNGKVYVVAGYQAYQIDPKTGEIEQRVKLPTAIDRTAGDTTYNGFSLLSDGNLVAKSLTRTKGSKRDSIQALLLDFDVQVPSQLVVLSPDLKIISVTPFDEPVLGRITNGHFDGYEYIYASGKQHLLRFTYLNGKVKLDSSWGPINYLHEDEKSATAPAMVGNFVLAQSNFQFAPGPLSLTAVSQKDSKQIFRMEPFLEQRLFPGSMQWSLPAVDLANRRVYSADVLEGKLAAIDFDPIKGFSIAWSKSQSALGFSALIGTPEQREIILEDGYFPSLNKTRLIWRDAKTGQEKLRSPSLHQGIGLPITPGFNGIIYYPSHAGYLYELRLR